MDDLVQTITKGHVTEVKIVLTSVVAALALYQVFLMAVGYGKIRLPFLQSAPASRAHRAIGDTIVVVTIVVGWMCLAFFGIEDEGDLAGFHVVVSFALVGVLGLKVAVVRWWHSMGRFLPVLGVSVLALFLMTWMSSSGAYL